MADTIEVSLSNLKERIKAVAVIRKPRYSVRDDEWLLPMIKRLAKMMSPREFQFWCYVANKDKMTVITITPHP